MGYSPWCCKESDTTEATEHALTEAEDIKKRWQEYIELYRKDNDPDNHDGVIT